MSNRDAHTIFQQLLTDVQEKEILDYINDLLDRDMPPTPQILENIIIKIVKHSIRQNWVSCFCKRHGNKIKSLYLCSIDQARKVADNSAYFAHFYQTVWSLFDYLMFSLILMAKCLLLHIVEGKDQ
jgi:hypothetical protein